MIALDRLELRRCEELLNRYRYCDERAKASWTRSAKVSWDDIAERAWSEALNILHAVMTEAEP